MYTALLPVITLIVSSTFIVRYASTHTLESCGSVIISGFSIISTVEIELVSIHPCALLLTTQKY